MDDIRAKNAKWGRNAVEVTERRIREMRAAEAGSRVEPGDHRAMRNLKLVTSASHHAMTLAGSKVEA